MEISRCFRAEDNVLPHEAKGEEGVGIESMDIVLGMSEGDLLTGAMLPGHFEALTGMRGRLQR